MRPRRESHICFKKNSDAMLAANFSSSKSERESVFEKNAEASSSDAWQVVAGATGVFKSTISTKSQDLLQNHSEDEGCTVQTMPGSKENGTVHARQKSLWICWGVKSRGAR